MPRQAGSCLSCQTLCALARLTDPFEQEYAGRFDWRRDSQVANLRELASLPGSGGEPLDPPFMSYFEYFMLVESIEDALRKSIYFLFPEASQTYVLGFFQASLLTSGAVLERVLKLEYRVSRGALPKGNWTLGRCIHELDWSGTRVKQDHLDTINRVKGPRNSSAHALLEHESPSEASRGGKRRGVEVRPSGHYLIEPFRGDALEAISAVYSVLSDLYEDEPPPKRQPPGT